MDYLSNKRSFTHSTLNTSHPYSRINLNSIDQYYDSKTDPVTDRFHRHYPSNSFDFHEKHTRHGDVGSYEDFNVQHSADKYYRNSLKKTSSYVPEDLSAYYRNFKKRQPSSYNTESTYKPSIYTLSTYSSPRPSSLYKNYSSNLIASSRYLTPKTANNDLDFVNFPTLPSYKSSINSYRRPSTGLFDNSILDSVEDLYVPYSPNKRHTVSSIKDEVESEYQNKTRNSYCYPHEYNVEYIRNLHKSSSSNLNDDLHYQAKDTFLSDIENNFGITINEDLYGRRLGELKRLDRKLDEKVLEYAVSRPKNNLEKVSCFNDSELRNHFENKEEHNEKITTKDEELIKLVLEPGERFLPDEIFQEKLPSGSQATIYKQTRQKVHEKIPDMLDSHTNYYSPKSENSYEDKQSAELAIDNFNKETEKLRADLGTLDEFIRKNKTLFPPNLIVLQRFIYHKPSPRSLIDTLDNQFDDIISPMEIVSRVAFHDKPCRVKIKETLVVPKNTNLKGYDIEGVIERCYHRMEDVDIVYEDEEGMKAKMQKQKQKQDEEMKQGRLDDDASFRLKLKDNYTKIDNENDTINIFNRKKQMLAEYNFPKKDGDNSINSSQEVASKEYNSYNNPPIFLTQLKNEQVVEGHDVILKCKIKGHRVVNWFKEGDLIRESNQLLIETSDEECSLLLKSCTYENQGTYEVQAANHNGAVVSRATINVLLTSDTVEELSFLSKPPPCVQGIEGQQVTLSYVLKGSQSPQVSWYKESKEIKDENEKLKILIRKESDWKHELIINNVSPSDAGTYCFDAKSGSQGLLHSVVVQVLPQNRTSFKVDPGPQEHIKMKPIFIMQLPPQQNFTKGQDLVIGCQVDEAEKEEISFKPSVLKESTHEDLCSDISTDSKIVLESENSENISTMKSIDSISSSVDNNETLQMSLVETNTSSKICLNNKDEEVISGILDENEKSLEKTKNMSDIGDPVDAEDILIESSDFSQITNDHKSGELPSNNKVEGFQSTIKQQSDLENAASTFNFNNFEEQNDNKKEDYTGEINRDESIIKNESILNNDIYIQNPRRNVIDDNINDVSIIMILAMLIRILYCI